MKVSRLSHGRNRCMAVVGELTARYRVIWARREGVAVDKQCECIARVRIDGADYCKRHAGAVLLNAALDRGEAP